MRSLAQNWEIFKESRVGMSGLIIIIAFGIFGLLWPIMINFVWDPLIYHPVVGFDPFLMHPSPPAAGHLLGTDPIGRDILAQLMFSTGREFLLGVLVFHEPFDQTRLIGFMIIWLALVLFSVENLLARRRTPSTAPIPAEISE